MERIINNKMFAVMISFLVVYKLIYPDIKMMWISKSFDWFSYSMSAFCMVVFATEMIMQCIVVEGYFLQFFFWVDFVSTITIIADIGWIWSRFETDADDSDATEFTGLTKASKAAKIIKIIRIIRVIRILRLFK